MSATRHTLHRETEAAKVLKAQMADLVGEDEQFWSDVVEGETSLNEAISLAVELLVEDTANVKGLNDMIEKLAGRKERILERINNTRTALAVALEIAGKKKVEHAAVTISVRPTSPSVRVVDEALIPSSYFKASEPRLDKRALLAALKDKQIVPGAQLSNGETTLALAWS